MKWVHSWYPWLVAWLSIVHFHLFWKWPGYSRTFVEDWRRTVSYFRNPVLCRPDQRLASTLLQISDPMSVPWNELHEGAFYQWPLENALMRFERGLKWNRPFLLVLWGALLKRTGDLTAAETFYRRMLERNIAPFEAQVGLGDIFHLLANWRKELQEYKARAVYPETAMMLARGTDQDRLSEIETFTHGLAIAAYTRAIELRPQGAFAQIQRARAFLDEGDASSGYADLLQARAAVPDNSLIGLRCAYLEALRGDPAALLKIRVLYESRPDILWEFGNLKRVEIKSYRQVAKLQSQKRRRFLAPARVIGHVHLVSHGVTSKHSFNIGFPQTDLGILDRVRDLGWGFKLADERYLVEDSKALSHSELKLFSRSVLVYNDTHALVGTRLKTEHVDDPNVIILPGATYNYYHWIFDTLGALLILRGLVDLSQYRLIMKGELYQFQQDSLRLAFATPPDIRSTPLPWPRFLYSKALHLPYPARLNVPHPQAIRAVREALSRHAEKPRAGKRIYITRSQVVGRRTVNEYEVTSVLASRGFAIYDPVGATIEDQIEFFRDVEIVVAPAGAALTNLVFCPKQTRVIITTSGYHNFETFTTLVNVLGLETWSCLGKGVTQPNPFFVWSIFEMSVDSHDLAICVDAALASINHDQGGPA